MKYGLPPINSNVPVYDISRRLIGSATWNNPWSNWFSQSWIILNDLQNSGVTAERPTKNLYIGKFFFDTSLGAKGKPIWLGKDTATWVLADGTAA